MKYSEIAHLKKKMMTMLENAVDQCLNQLQANEHVQAAKAQIKANEEGHAGTTDIVDLQPGYFDAALALDFPKGYGTNGEGFVIVCNPVITLKDVYRKMDAQNYSHKIMSDKLRQAKENK